MTGMFHFYAGPVTEVREEWYEAARTEWKDDGRYKMRNVGLRIRYLEKLKEVLDTGKALEDVVEQAADFLSRDVVRLAITRFSATTITPEFHVRKPKPVGASTAIPGILARLQVLESTQGIDPNDPETANVIELLKNRMRLHDNRHLALKTAVVLIARRLGMIEPGRADADQQLGDLLFVSSLVAHQNTTVSDAERRKQAAAFAFDLMHACGWRWVQKNVERYDEQATRIAMHEGVELLDKALMG